MEYTNKITLKKITRDGESVFLVSIGDTEYGELTYKILNGTAEIVSTVTDAEINLRACNTLKNYLAKKGLASSATVAQKVAVAAVEPPKTEEGSKPAVESETTASAYSVQNISGEPEYKQGESMYKKDEPSEYPKKGEGGGTIADVYSDEQFGAEVTTMVYEVKARQPKIRIVDDYGGDNQSFA